VCEKHIDITDRGLWLFILIILIAIISRIVYSHHIIKRIKQKEDIMPLDRAKRIFSTRRKTLLFTIMLVLLGIASLLYSYFFLLCPNIFFNYSWILLMLLILIPLVIQAVLRKIQYTEGEDLSKEKMLEDVHYQNILRMIDLENEILAEEENTIANKLYELSKQADFKDIIEKHSELKKIYKDLVELYTKYKDKKNPFSLEKDFCDEINGLDKDATFKKDVERIPELKSIYERLARLYAQYEEKQKLYDRLDQIQDGQDVDGSKKKTVK